MKSLRVAMIAPPWLPIPPSSYGGIENVLAALVPALRKLGAEVELFTIGDSTIRSDKKHALYQTGQYDSIYRPYYDALPILVAHVLAALNDIRKDGKFDIIHDHNPYIGPAIMAYADQSLPPVLHTLHGPPFTTPDRLALGIPDDTLMWKQLAKLNRVHYVSISEAARKNAPSQLKRQLLEPIYSGIDISKFPFVTKKGNYFATLSRFHPDKGNSIAVRVCAELGYKLKMAGWVGDIGNPKKLILELANPSSHYRGLADFRYYSDKIFPYLLDSRVDYIGEVKGKQKLNFLGRAQALLFPIQWDEPFGMIAVEALACGTPVVTMARGALPEIIEHGVNGFLAKNETEFKRYVGRVGEIDPAVCRQSVEQKFSATIMAKNYLDSYQAIVSQTS